MGEGREIPNELIDHSFLAVTNCRLLSPFRGITVESYTPTVVTRGGRTLAVAILNARAHGPRNILGWHPHQALEKASRMKPFKA